MAKWKTILLVLVGLLLTSCSSGRMVPVDKVQPEKTIRVYLKSGQKIDAILLKNTGNELILVNKNSHEKENIRKDDVRRIDYLEDYLDYHAYPISRAEVKKYRGNKNSFTYTIGGIALGGIGGIVAALPFWYADTGVRPYFVGGVTAVAGGIFFGYKGHQRDEEVALRTIRILRIKKEKYQNIEKEKQEELQRLQELERKKMEMKKKLKNKKTGDK